MYGHPADTEDGSFRSFGDTLPMPDKDRANPLLLIGGGGHALVVAEAAALAGWSVAGFFDDNVSPPLVAGRGDRESAVPRLGPLDRLGAIEDRGWIIAVGDLRFRRELIGRLRERASAAATVVHPSAFVSPSADIGRGVYIGPKAVIHSRARIGDHAIINSGAIIEHDCLISDNAHVAPGSVLGGGVSVGADTLIGLGSRVLPTIEIGRTCVVGAGAVVVAPVRDGTTVVGVPASPRR